MDSPCKDCNKRQVGCHSDCSDYEYYKVKIEQQKEARRLQDIKPQYKDPIPGGFFINQWKKKIKEE